MPAAIVQQQSGNTRSATPTSVTITLASPAVAGNVLLPVVNADSTLPTPTGWTLDESEVNFSGLYLWRKTALGGETGRHLQLPQRGQLRVVVRGGQRADAAAAGRPGQGQDRRHSHPQLLNRHHRSHCPG